MERRTQRDWILSCAAGEFLGIAVAAGTAVGVRLAWGEPTNGWQAGAMVALMVLAGAIEGWAVAWFQHRVLRRIVDVPWRPWLLATVAVAAGGWLLGSVPSLLLAAGGEAGAGPPGWLQVLGGAAMGGVLGAAFGWAQWRVLRRTADGAGPWIGYNALGWALALTWIFLVASSLPEDVSVADGLFAGALAGLLSGVSVGTATLPAVARLRPQP